MRITEGHNMISDNQALEDLSKLVDYMVKHSEIKDVDIFDIRQLLNRVRNITLKYTNEDI